MDLRHSEPVDFLPAPAAPDRSRVTAAAVGTAVVVALAGAALTMAYGRTDTANAVATAVVVSSLAVVGAVIAFAVPANRVGWLLLAAATLLGAGVGLTEAGVHGVIISPGSVPAADYYAAIGPGLRGAGWLLAVVAVPVVFPDGRLPGTGWRWVGWCAVGAVTFLFLGTVLSPHAQETRLVHWQSPLGLPAAAGGVADAISLLGVLAGLVASAGAVAGLVTRWRRQDPLVRQQLLLFTLAACPPAAVLVVAIATGDVPGWVFELVVLPFAATIAVATLQHGLYDLRRAAYRSLLWLTMSGVLIGIYAGVVATAAALVPDTRAWWPPVVAAGASALLLVPIRENLQRGINRVVYGRWHEPYEVLAGLGERLEAAADIDRLLEAAVHELTTGLELRGVAVRNSHGVVIAGADGGFANEIALHAYGTDVGALTYLAPSRQFTAAEDRLLHDLARQLGGVLHARALNADLQRARECVVGAREEERRRLRRDLHDGIGPALAGLTLKAETARALLPPDAARAASLLQELGNEIRRTVLDVRRVVEGLRPPALDDLGLLAASTQAISRITTGADLAVDVHTEFDLPALPAAVEVAAYRIVLEAVTNVLRHANAEHVQVLIALGEGALEITIADDGTGLANAGHDGNGVITMRERAEELGGQLTVTDSSRGVTVHARLPVPSVPMAPAQAPAVTA